MTAPSRQPKSCVRRIVDLFVFVAIVAAGGACLVPLYHWLHPVSATASAARGTKAPVRRVAARKVSLRPDGRMFDDFDYSGRDDPSLKAHGWDIRSYAGGPGIQDTWSGKGISFPTVSSARGGRVLQLQLTSDGTKAGTHQTELESAHPYFADGTYAARVYFTVGPAIGTNGDHINESFYAISAPGETQHYSELDYEYMPNGGWGSSRPELDTTSWHSSKDGDRVYHPTYTRLHGWHTVMFTSVAGKTVYYIDGQEVFSNDAAYSLHGPVDVAFSTWLIDLPFAGQRTWNMQINWFYYQAGKALTLSQVDKAVDGYYAQHTPYVNTLTTTP